MKGMTKLPVTYLYPSSKVCTCLNGTRMGSISSRTAQPVAVSSDSRLSASSCLAISTLSSSSRSIMLQVDHHLVTTSWIARWLSEPR